jgi:cytochrome c peroxidase
MLRVLKFIFFSYDDGSYGPVLLRLAWHASGTYDKDTKTGGSNSASMRKLQNMNDYIDE